QIEATATKKDNRPCLVWTLKVLGPRFAGRKHWHRDFLDWPETFGYLKRNLSLFGVQLTRLSDLPQHYPLLLGKAVEGTLRTYSSGFQATQFNRLAGAAGGLSASQGGNAGGGTDAGGIAGLAPF